MFNHTIARSIIGPTLALMFCVATAWGQTGTRITIRPKKVKVSAALNDSPSGICSVNVCQGRGSYGRVTLATDNGISTSYGMHARKGPSFLRTVHMGWGPQGDSFASGLVTTDRPIASKVSLGGSVDVDTQPEARLWLHSDQPTESFQKFRMKLDVDARRPNRWPLE